LDYYYIVWQFSTTKFDSKLEGQLS